MSSNMSEVLKPTDQSVECDNGITPKSTEITKPETRTYELLWKNILVHSFFHLVALFGIYLIFTSAKLYTSIFAFILYVLGGLGITAGVHRLWSHRAFKATLPLRLLLAIFNTLAYQNSILHWARDHRVHHKYSDTDADPHNASRGFFFSHVGWLLVRKHPAVAEMGKDIDVSDLMEDPIIVFQHKYYPIIMPLICFVVPTITPMYLWDETFINAFSINMFRYVFTLNATWLVNSAAHMWGQKPYDRFVKPTENLSVTLLSLGEGWHNFHHTFPYDYQTAELGKYTLNFSTTFINLCAKIGWAYDLKTISEKMVKRKVRSSGDGSHNVWGWGDKDQPEEDYRDAVIVNKKD